MHIEDLIIQLSRIRGINSADMSIIDSFSDQFYQGTGLTEKQSQLSLRILNRYFQLLSDKLKIDVSPHLTTPKFRLPLRKSVIDHTIKILDGSKIEVRFAYNETLVNAIRKFKTESDQSSQIMWDRPTTSWIFNLSERNIKFLMNLATQVNFTFDDEFQKYVDSVEDVVNNMEKYAPMLVIDNRDLKIANSPKNMPEIDTDDILEAIFQARTMGVTLWDNYINEYLDVGPINGTLKKFLTSNVTDEFKLAPTESDIFALKQIVKYSGPTLVIIPGGSELEKIQTIYDILKGSGTEDKNMSVLFRLPNETGKKFNDFVKNQGINGPICEETKVVFVSTKLPKPLINSKIRFNNVINMGYAMAHYSLKQYTKNHQNFINFGVKIKAQGFNFAEL